MTANSHPLSTNKDIVGRWRIGKRLGAGGQGAVWEVRLVTGRSPPRALKACFLEGENERARFEREVQLLKQCQSNHILPIIESNLDWTEHVEGKGPFAYFVSERCIGSLHDLAHTKTLAWRLGIFEQACAAVEFLHSLPDPMLHRDLKPENFLLAEEPSRLVLADFGIARTETTTALTQTHEIVGTQFYRAVEILHGERGDTRSDIYSLGRILEWLVTAQNPDQIQPKPTPRGAEISNAGCEALDGVISRAVATNPTERFQTVGELRANLPTLWLDIRPPNSASFKSPPGLPMTVFTTGLSLAGQGDTVGWRKLENDLRLSYLEVLKTWCAESEGVVRSRDDLAIATGKLVKSVLPRMALPLAGIISGNSAFMDQRKCIDDLLSVEGWEGSGQTLMVKARYGLAYIFHTLHGATCLERGHVVEAFRLASVGIPSPSTNYPLHPLWRMKHVAGWPALFDGNCATAWTYVSMMREQHDLLSQIFVLPRDYQIALAAYSMLVCLTEFATDAAALVRGGPDVRIGFDYPPMFATMETQIIVAASARVFADKKIVTAILDECNADRGVIGNLWPAWRTAVTAWVKAGSEGLFFLDDVHIPDLAL